MNENEKQYTIKPLPWGLDNMAITPVGEYHVYPDEWHFYGMGKIMDVYKCRNRGTGKRAAQAHYEALVKKCLNEVTP